jgi:hypothetical protein
MGSMKDGSCAGQVLAIWLVCHIHYVTLRYVTLRYVGTSGTTSAC